MARSLAVFGMVFAGVFVLAGPGWALLAGAVLVAVLWRAEPDWRCHALRARSWLLTAWRVVRTAPRRAVAMTGMGAGVVLLPAGMALAAGTGAALIAAAAALVGVSLLTGQGA